MNDMYNYQFFRKTKNRRPDELSEGVYQRNALACNLTAFLQQKGPEKERLVWLWKQKD